MLLTQTGIPDSPSERTRDGPRARARGDVLISPNRDEGRNRSPRPAAVPDRESEVRNRRSREGRQGCDSGKVFLRTRTALLGMIEVAGLMPTSGALASRRTPGTPSDRGRASGPTARSAPGNGGPDVPRICAQDNPNHRNTRMQSSLALHADVSSVSCVRVMMGAVGIAPLVKEVLGMSQECSGGCHVLLF